MKRVVLLASFCAGGWAAWAQGPTVTPGALSFTYQMNSASRPGAQTVKVSLPTASALLPVVVTNVTVPSNPCVAPVPSPCGWLAVTPDQGHAPLTLSVSVNPTGLTPGSYPGSFVVDTVPASGSPATVNITLSISNPPSTLLVSSLSANYTPTAVSGGNASLTFTYTTGASAATLVTSELDVSYTGDIIPFNVTAANATGSGSGGSTAVWLRVSSKSPTQGAALSTSGSAGVGSLVPIFVTLDYATLQGLGIGNYFGTVTVAAVDAKTNGSKSVSVSLVVSAGAPTVTSVFPQSVIAAPPIDPVFTIYGSNFTANTSVFLDVGATSYQLQQAVLVSPKIVQVTVPAKYLPLVVAPAVYPFTCTLTVRNGGFPAVAGTFQLTNPAAPSISLIVNAASYLPISKFSGTGVDPALAPLPQTAVSPREVISIFGQNLGPADVSSAVPLPAVGLLPSMYDTTWGNISVTFTYLDTSVFPAVLRSVLAPILMTSSNQVNAIVPKQLAQVIGTGAPTAGVTVTNGLLTSGTYSVTVLNEDPGIFTFGGLGQGQGAVINYDVNSAATINSKTNAEPRGNVIAIFATGLGELTDPTILDGALTSATAAGVHLADEVNVRVNIQGQPAVVLYAGSSPGAVAGLVQVNAIVPPTSSTGPAIPITLTIGDKTVARQAQPGVTLAVK